MVDVEVLEAITTEVCHVLAENNAAHSCIAGSALMTKVLQQLGVTDAYRLTVGVTIRNVAGTSQIRLVEEQHPKVYGLGT